MGWLTEACRLLCVWGVCVCVAGAGEAACVCRMQLGGALCAQAAMRARMHTHVVWFCCSKQARVHGWGWAYILLPHTHHALFLCSVVVLAVTAGCCIGSPCLARLVSRVCISLHDVHTQHPCSVDICLFKCACARRSPRHMQARHCIRTAMHNVLVSRC